MELKRSAVFALVLCELALSSCAIFYPSIPLIEFAVESDRLDIELNVIRLSRGSHRTRDDGVIVVSNNFTSADITFIVRSMSETGRFVARTTGHTGLKGGMSGVRMTYGFGGGMWLAVPETNFGPYVVSGVAASPTKFVVGRIVRNNDGVVPLIEMVAPHTGVQFDSLSPGMVLMGRGGASVFAQGSFRTEGRSLDIYAPLGSCVLIEQVDGMQEFEVDSSLPLHVEMLPGRAKIRWFPTGSDESHAEVVIDQVTDKFGHRDLSFSSMLDK